VSEPAVKPREPIWPDALFRALHERDRARDVAVALEQENARLRSRIKSCMGVHLSSPVRDGARAYWYLNDTLNEGSREIDLSG
jgi:hypothetical protein